MRLRAGYEEEEKSQEEKQMTPSIFQNISNWTEWSTIQGVIERVISKSDEREARGWFKITSTIYPWTVLHSVQLLLLIGFSKNI